MNNKAKEMYDDSVESTKEYTKAAFRATKLAVIGSCLLVSAMPVAYMSACEEYMNVLANRVKVKIDEDDDNAQGKD